MTSIFQKIARFHFSQLLSHPPYLYFTLSVVFSQIAINMMNIVFIFLIDHLSSSTFLVSLLILTFLFPQILLSFVGGMIADTKGKKNILVYGNVARAAVLMLLYFHNDSVSLIFICAFIISIITQFYIPAETPMIPKLVKKQFLTQANSLFGIALFGSILIGYVLAGPTLEVVGRSAIFIILAILFIISALCIQLIPKEDFELEKSIVPSLRAVKLSIGEEFSLTYKVLKDTAGVVPAFFLLSSSQLIILILATIVTGYARKILEIPIEKLSLIVFSPAAIGMVIASLLLGTLYARSDKNKIMTIGLFITAAVLFLFPFTNKIVTRSLVGAINMYLPSFLDITAVHFAIILAFFVGFSNALIFIPSQTIIQEKIPESFRSKVYGLLFGMIGIFSLIPILLTGKFANDFGVDKVLFFVGAVIFCIGILRSGIAKYLRKKF